LPHYFIINIVNYSTKAPDENKKISFYETKVSFLEKNVVFWILEYYNNNRNSKKKVEMKNIVKDGYGVLEV